MPWLRRFALFLVFVAALFRPAAVGESCAPAAGSQTRIGAIEIVAATLVKPASAATKIGAKHDENASLEARLAEHESQLAAYRENPFKFDNRGDLAQNAARPEVQQRIIDGRIRHLEGEIRNFQQQLVRLRSGSVES